jgi:hypothetical protein
MATEPRHQLSDTNAGSRHRALLLSGLPVTERRLQVAGVSTPYWKGVQARRSCCSTAPVILPVCGCG